MNPILRVAAAAVCLPALLSPLAGHAAANDRQARTWAASCAACHGTDGRAQAGMASLAGRDAGELYTLLSEFKSGVRPATVMHQHTKGYTDDELKRLANWFAAQSKN